MAKEAVDKSSLKSFSIEGNKEGNGLLDEDIREEVVWALRKLKVKATAGKYGITAEMNREVWALVGTVRVVLD